MCFLYSHVHVICAKHANRFVFVWEHHVKNLKPCIYSNNLILEVS